MEQSDGQFDFPSDIWAVIEQILKDARSLKRVVYGLWQCRMASKNRTTKIVDEFGTLLHCSHVAGTQPKVRFLIELI